jgi:hypothetical protein
MNSSLGGLLFDPGEEVLDDVELDVGFEQRQADVAQRLLDVVLGQLRHAGQAVLGGAESFAQRVEHGCTGGGRAA